MVSKGDICPNLSFNDPRGQIKLSKYKQYIILGSRKQPASFIKVFTKLVDKKAKNKPIEYNNMQNYL